MITRLTRRRGFHCLHRYNVDSWSDEKNTSEFGACFTPSGHGHDYEIEVTLEGPIDAETGMVLNLIDVDVWLEKTLSQVNGKHLNFDLKDFTGNPTTENLALYLFNKLQPSTPTEAKFVKLRLFEYEDLWVDVWP